MRQLRNVLSTTGPLNHRTAMLRPSVKLSKPFYFEMTTKSKAQPDYPKPAHAKRLSSREKKERNTDRGLSDMTPLQLVDAPQNSKRTFKERVCLPGKKQERNLVLTKSYRNKALQPFAGPNGHFDLHWNYWNGKPYDLAEVSLQWNKLARRIVFAQSSLELAQGRLATSQPHSIEFDKFMVRFHQMSLDVLQYLLKFWRFHCETDVLTLLISAAIIRHPRHRGIQKLYSTVTKLGNCNFALRFLISLLEDVRFLGVSRQCDPLSFALMVERFKIERPFTEIKSNLLLQQKEARRLGKLQNPNPGHGFSHKTASFPLYIQASKACQLHIEKNNMLRQVGPLYDAHPHFWPAESTYAIIMAVTTRLNNILKRLRDFSKFLYYSDGIPLSWKKVRKSRITAWNRYQEIERDLRLGVEEILHLNADVRKMRLFIATRCSQQTMERDIEISRNFFNMMNATIQRGIASRGMPRVKMRGRQPINAQAAPMPRLATEKTSPAHIWEATEDKSRHFLSPRVRRVFAKSI